MALLLFPHLSLSSPSLHVHTVSESQMNQKSILFLNSYFFVFFSLLPRITFCYVNPKFETCQPKTCGNVKDIRYPFYINGSQERFCGFPDFGLSCVNNSFPILNLFDTKYIVHEISYDTQSIRVSDAALSSISNTTACLPRSTNLTLFGNKFRLAPNQTDLFLVYGCSDLPSLREYRIGCSAENERESVLAIDGEGAGNLSYALKNCTGGLVKAKVEDKKGSIEEALGRGFVLNWTASDCSLCTMTGGKCGFDFDPEIYSFRCYCHDRDHARKCDPADDKSRALKLGLGLGLGLGTGFLAILITGCLIGRRYKRKNAAAEVQFESRNTHSDAYSNPDPENGIFFEVPLFSYKELEDATNNFDHARELGDGGFGIVYYGKLKDGREVAVKRLYEHNYRRVEQFRNEVDVLTRLRHRNLVSLYGCTSRQSRDLLLVYEYIPNGTVAFHLHGDLTKSDFLPWSIRIKIAIETASALSYLHASDIIHRDVKTNNILLDNSYCVKVADFGLSRLFPNDVSHVSTAPQGTPGYVDPEYYQCYQLTTKSDVYSFGVVLIELISSKPAVDTSRHKDEINLSNLAVKKIQESAFTELVDPSLGFESDTEVKRMIVSVAELAFQCLQRDKELRPSMDEVSDVLRRIESGKNEPEHLEEADVHVQSTGVLHSNTLLPPPPPSPDWDVVGLLKNMKLPPSPNTVTDKWESKSTTPNYSG